MVTALSQNWCLTVKGHTSCSWVCTALLYSLGWITHFSLAIPSVSKAPLEMQECKNLDFAPFGFLRVWFRLCFSSLRGCMLVLNIQGDKKKGIQHLDFSPPLHREFCFFFLMKKIFMGICPKVWFALGMVFICALNIWSLIQVLVLFMFLYSVIAHHSSPPQSFDLHAMADPMTTIACWWLDI